ncbi:hypothetical protein [Streptomyces sp. UH6]|uniref:hypothetical protein n=1 Tax=Streptomyces sp. UH6 TaxID=2748379 RepID=UPI0015D511F5|nr:hypothetical protein [Streptomyces sp. UH6]NYV74976.1 hypothetical protein [Streptomyces sp. UH6]
MDVVIAVFAVIFLLLVSLAAWGTVKAVGAARRGVDRTITQARRSVEDTTLRARSMAQPGPVGELAELRLKLRTSMRATQQALEAGSADDGSLKESLALFERLGAHGRELDGDLKRLESEPDRATLAERLPGLRERTEQIVRSADSLRWAARDRARRFAEDDLESLSAQIDVEAGALRHWDRVEEAPQQTPPQPSPEPSRGRRTEQEAPREGRAALNPSRPRTPNPWEKLDRQTRPESTT